MSGKYLNPDYLFDISWEICNKISNIHNAISSKALTHINSYGNKYICIGPDLLKDDASNSVFIEDNALFESWRTKAQNDNVFFRTGRWNIPGKPIAVLVDYSHLFSEKDNIFTQLWDKYGLDSLHGDWDYLEPAVFGYAAGQVIEHFYDYHLSSKERFVSHFHDWKTGAGILYLNDQVPQAATIFTTYGTVLGKAMSDQGMNPAKEFKRNAPQTIAQKLNVTSKNSLEQLASKNADAFTAINNAVYKECKLIFDKPADVITPIDSVNSSWEDLINNYNKAYSIAIEKVNGRAELFKHKKQPAEKEELEIEKHSQKKKKIKAVVEIPDELKELQKLSKNIWWSWNHEATELFESVDSKLWKSCEKNPIRLLENLTTEHYNTLLKNKNFMALYHRMVKTFDEYMNKGKSKPSKQIAYFSMEYGLHESIKIYSGGLGVLAGDYLKQASDDNINLIGVGLLYRYGYFSQRLSGEGDQLPNYHPHNFYHMSATPAKNDAGEDTYIEIDMPGRTLKAKIWKIDVGRIPLYLLDTDLPENKTYDRVITHRLYGGDWENRLKQEILLGIGGIRLLETLGLNPDIYHCNEGHAAFTGLQRLVSLIQNEKLSYEEALEVVKASCIFTTHTPVPAGHDFFSEDMLRTYMSNFVENLGITWKEFMALGKMKPENPDERFSMSVLAANLSQEINGVSKLHGKVSREMFSELYPGYFPEELHIGYVTNGVHYLTWTAKEWQELYKKYFGENFLNNCSDPDCWKKIYDVADETIWQKRNDQRKLLIDYIKNRIKSNTSQEKKSNNSILQIVDQLNENALTIGFARRFATYKRANLLFNDLETLSRIVNMKNMPVLFIFAGKAHPADKAGQDFIKKIVENSNKKQFKGKILFIEDYDMELARHLVQGVDIWLNTPIRPMEASGTSGQKATLNGVLNLSVLDGWWAEGYKPKAGWYLKEKSTYDNKDMQNELDASIIYNLLEKEIIPMFYKRNEKQVPEEWIAWVKNNIAQIAPHYTNKRMLDDYINRFYKRNFEFSDKLKHDSFAKAKELALWKKQIADSWDKIKVKSCKIPGNSKNASSLDKNFVAEITLDLNKLSPNDVGIEALFIKNSIEEKDKTISIHTMEQVKCNNNTVTFRLNVPVSKPGFTKYKFRIYPKHELLAHRQDFRFTRWL